MNENEKLREIVQFADTANTLTAPLVSSIENLLELAAAAVDSADAAVIVRGGAGETDDLRFLVAVGAVADKLRDVRIPQGKGIAGFVFSSGQPIAVADVARDANFYAEIDRQTGFSTQTILATPLRHDGEIIGVLEFVNRVGDLPLKPFSPEEMDKAALFAEPISTLVDAHESAALLESFCFKMAGDCDRAELREWLKTVRGDETHRDLLEIALLVRELAQIGDAERRLCREILQSFARFAGERDSNQSFLNF